MVRVDGKAELRFRGIGQSGEQGIWSLNHLAAGFADEVPVRRSRQVIGGRPVAKVRVNDDTQPLQLIEVPVNSRQVDIRCLRLDRRRQILCRVVAVAIEENPQEKAPRRCDPSPVLAKHVEGALHCGGVAGPGPRGLM